MLALCAVKSGKIMAFKFPVLKPKTIDCSGLPVHDFKCLTILGELLFCEMDYFHPCGDNVTSFMSQKYI